MILKWAANE